LFNLFSVLIVFVLIVFDFDMRLIRFSFILKYAVLSYPPDMSLFQKSNKYHQPLRCFVMTIVF